MKPAELQAIADVCHMLADPTRASIVALLARGPKPVMSLVKELKLRQPTVSHHLGLLRNQHLLDGKRKGKQVFYSLSRGKLGVVREFLAKVK